MSDVRALGRARVDDPPRQWEPTSPVGHRCVFCHRPLRPGEAGQAVWDHDQAYGWQVLAFHESCREQAARDRMEG